jgi:hypothetical protein
MPKKATNITIQLAHWSAAGTAGFSIDSVGPNIATQTAAAAMKRGTTRSVS